MLRVVFGPIELVLGVAAAGKLWLVAYRFRVPITRAGTTARIQGKHVGLMVKQDCAPGTIRSLNAFVIRPDFWAKTYSTLADDFGEAEGVDCVRVRRLSTARSICLCFESRKTVVGRPESRCDLQRHSRCVFVKRAGSFCTR